MIPTGSSPESFDPQEEVDTEPALARSPTYQDMYFDVLVRSFYHEDRARFFLFVTGCAQIISMTLVTATYASFTENHPIIRAILGTLAFLLGMIAFVFRFSAA